MVAGDGNRQHANGPPDGPEIEQAPSVTLERVWRSVVPFNRARPRVQSHSGNDRRNREPCDDRRRVEIASDDVPEVTVEEEAEVLEPSGVERTLARDLSKEDVAQPEIGSGHHAKWQVRSDECDGRPDRTTHDDDVVGGERRHHRDGVLLGEERDEEKHERPDVQPSRRLMAIANVGKKRREIEERRHRVDAAGDPRDALGVNRQQHEHQPGEHRREQRQAAPRSTRSPSPAAHWRHG